MRAHLHRRPPSRNDEGNGRIIRNRPDRQFRNGVQKESYALRASKQWFPSILALLGLLFGSQDMLREQGTQDRSLDSYLKESC